MRPCKPERVAACLLAVLFILCASTARDARAQDGSRGVGTRPVSPAPPSPRQNVENAKARESAPNNESANARELVDEGLRLAEQKDWVAAFKAFNQALAVNPRYGDAYVGMGDAYMNMGKYKEAFAAYQQAIDVEPRNADAHYSLGAAYSDMGRYGDSFKPYVRAINLDPSFAEAHYGIGFAYLRLENFRDALTYLRQAVRLRPDFAEARLALGETYLGVRNVKAAEGELKLLAELDASAARVLEKEIREAASDFSREAAQPAPTTPAPARSEQAATPSREKPTANDIAPATPGGGVAPQQPAQAPRATRKSARESASVTTRRQAARPASAQSQNPAFELTFWESIKNSSEPEEFAAYLRRYPDGQFVDLARIRMRALEAKRGGSSETENTPRTEVAAANTEEAARPQQDETTRREVLAKPEAEAKPEVETKRQAAEPDAQPSPEPTPTPAAQPTPTPAPTAQPTPTPTAQQVTPTAAQPTPTPAIEQPTPPATEPTPAPARELASKPAPEPTPKPSSEQTPTRATELPSNTPTETQAQAASVSQTQKETLKEAQPLKATPTRVNAPPVEEKKVAAKAADEAESLTTVEDASSVLRRLFPSQFSYRVKTNGGAAPGSEVVVNYEPLDFDGCRVSWRDSNDTLSLSLSDLDAEALTVAPRTKPSTTFSIEVWNVTLATEGGRGAISEEKGDGSGAVNVYNGLDLQYDSRQKAERLAKALRQAIKLCAGKMM